MAIKKKDLPFIDYYAIKEKNNKKIRKIVFPNDVCFGIPSSNSNVIISGNLTVLGSFNQGGGGGGSGADPGASYVVIGLTASLANERALTAGAGINITDNGAGSTVEIINVGGIDAPSDAQYLTLATDGDLSNERVFTPSTGLNATDGGAGGSYTVTIDDDVVATVSGTTFTGDVFAPNITITNTGSFDYITASRLALAGGDTVDANSTANDFIIGTSESDHGMTIVSNASGEANIVLTDIAGTRIGGMRYQFSSDELSLRTGGADRLDIVADGTRPGGDIIYKLGHSSRRWTNFYSMLATFYDDVTMGENLSLTGSDPVVTVGDGTGVPSLLMNGEGGYMSASILYLGGAQAGAYTGGDDLVIGTITSTNQGMTIFSDPSSAGRVVFADTVGGFQGVVGYDHSVPSMFFTVEGSQRAELTTTTLRPASNAGIDLGSTSRQWKDLYVSQSINIAQGASVSAVLRFQASGGSNDIQFRNSTTLRWIFRHNIANGDDFQLTRRNSSGGGLDTPISADWTTGEVQINSASFLLHANPQSDLGADLGASNLRWNNLHVATASFVEIEAATGSFYHMTASYASVGGADAISEGVDFSVQGTGSIDYITGSKMRLAGAGLDDGAINAKDLVIGTPDKESSGITIIAAPAGGGVGRYSFLDSTSAAAVGGMQYQFAVDELNLIAGGVAVLELRSTHMAPNTDRAVDIGTSTQRYDESHVYDGLFYNDVSIGNDLSLTGSDPVVTIGDGTGVPTVDVVGTGGTLTVETGSIDFITGTKIALYGGDPTIGDDRNDDIIVGNFHSGIDIGMVFRAGAARTVRWTVEDTASGFDAQLRWSGAGFSVLTFRMSGQDRYIMGGSAFEPGADLTYDLGQSDARWNTLYAGTASFVEIEAATGSFYYLTSSFLGVGGADPIADGVQASIAGDVFLNSASPTLTVGDGTGGAGLAIRNSAGRIHIADTGAGASTIFLSGSNHGIRWSTNVGVAHGDLLDNAGHFRFRNSSFLDILGLNYTTNAVTASADVLLDSPNPTLTIGDQTGQPVIDMWKADASGGIFNFKTAGNTNYKRIRHGTGEDLDIDHFNGGVWETIAKFDSSKDVSLANHLLLTSSNPGVKIGDGSGSPQIQLIKGAAGAGIIYFNRTLDALAANDKAFFHQADETFALGHYNGAGWENVVAFDNSKNATMAANLSLTSSSPILTVGDYSASPDLIIAKGSGGTGELKFTSTDPNAKRIAQLNDESLVISNWNGSKYIDGLSFDSSLDFDFAANLSLTSSSPNLTVGDGTGTPEINIVKSDAGQGILDFAGGSGGGGIYWRFSSDGNENFNIERRHNDAFQGTSLSIATSDGGITMEANLALTSSSPALTIGDGTGIPQIYLDRIASNQGYILWREASVSQWALANQNDDSLQFLRYIGGVYSGAPMTFTNANGNISMEANLSLTSSSPVLDIGDGSGNPDIRFITNAQSEIKFLRSGFQDMRIGQEGSTMTFGQWNGASWVDIVTINSGTYEVEMSNDLTVAGTGSFLHVEAATKRFVINHPSKPGMKLRHGSLEGPEHGVYIRGITTGSIEYPDYWENLVDKNSITVQLTPIGKHQQLFVESINEKSIVVGEERSKSINAFYYVQAERIDVDKLEVEQ